MLTAIEWMRKQFIYDSGHLYRRATGKPVKASVTIAGYRMELPYAIWFHLYGELPPRGLLIDHINRDRRDNRIGNLRLATYIQNGYNRTSPHNPNGFKGITPSGRPNKPWRAQIRINGIRISLGRFKTKEEAAEAYRNAVLKHHGEFACLD